MSETVAGVIGWQGFQRALETGGTGKEDGTKLERYLIRDVTKWLGSRLTDTCRIIQAKSDPSGISLE